MDNTNSPVSASDAPNNSKEVKDSKVDKINKWFFDPISDFGTDESFIIFMVVLPMYEKYLRTKIEFAKSAFSKGSKIFNTIGKDLGLSADASYLFWQTFRNGMCHMAMPKKGATDVTYKLYRDKPFIAQYDESNNEFSVNAFNLRDKVKDLIIHNPNIFKNSDYPFAVEYMDND